jgi:hypothetical protein
MAFVLSGCTGPDPGDRGCPSPDEDGDCVPDHSDNCPGLANRDQQDTDSDGVGDACDPQTGVPHELHDFFPFNERQELSRSMGGDWQSDWSAKSG